MLEIVQTISCSAQNGKHSTNSICIKLSFQYKKKKKSNTKTPHFLNLYSPQNLIINIVLRNLRVDVKNNSYV